MFKRFFYLLPLICINESVEARTEYIINNSKITSVNTKDSGIVNTKNNKSSYEYTDQNRFKRNIQRARDNEFSSAIMQLQEQIIQLSKIVEKNSNRIASLEKQNTLLLQDNIALQGKIDDLTEKYNSKQQSSDKKNKTSKKNNNSSVQNKSNKKGKVVLEQPKRTKPKEKLSAVKKLILNERYTVAINDITEFLDVNGNSTYASEFYFWRGVAYFKKGKFSLASEDFVDSYAKTPSKNIAKYVLYFLGKSLRKLGKISDAQIIEGKISVDYPGFNFKKEYNISDIK